MKHKYLFSSLLIVIIVIIFIFILFSRNWPLRFKKEFDNFFGEKIGRSLIKKLRKHVCIKKLVIQETYLK